MSTPMVRTYGCERERGPASETMRWPHAIDEYLNDQQHVGRINGDSSVRTYVRYLERHAEDALEGPVEATRADVKRTLARWGHPNTRGLAHTVLVSFYDWMLTEGYRMDNPARQVARTRMRKRTTVRFTRSEVQALIAACETQRERWVILLGVCTGARASELIAFQGRHFQREGFVWFSADITKGKRERWVPVLPELRPVVEEIRASVRSDHYVIETYKNSSPVPRSRIYPISHQSLLRLLRGVADRAGITTRVYPHLLRHAYGDHVAKHAGLRVAQALMGHASVQTTASVYVDRPDLDELTSSVQGLAYQTGESHLLLEARQALEEYAQSRDAIHDARLIAELAVLVDHGRRAGMDIDTIAALASGKEAV